MGNEADETRREGPEGDGGDARWHPVYAAVVLTTALVIAALWAFSRAYSS